MVALPNAEEAFTKAELGSARGLPTVIRWAHRLSIRHPGARTKALATPEEALATRMASARESKVFQWPKEEHLRH